MRIDYPLGRNLSGFIRARAGQMQGPAAATLVRGWIGHSRFLCYFSLCDQERARRELERISLLPGLPAALELEYLSDTCNLANQFSLWDKMIPALDRLETVSKDLDYTLGLAQTDYYRATLLINEGNYQQAIEQYRKALASAVQANDRNMQAEILNDIGFCHQRSGEGGKAMEFYRESLSAREQTGNMPGQAESLNNIGLALCHLKKFAEAGQTLNRALQIEQTIGDKIGTGYTLVNLGYMAGKDGDHRLEEVLYRRALVIRLEIGDTLGLAYCYLNLAHLAHVRGEKENTLSLLDRSISAFTRADDAVGQTEARLFKAQYLLDYRYISEANDEMESIALLLNNNTTEGQCNRYRQLLDRVAKEK